MIIEQAQSQDMDRIMEIVENSRQYMRRNGNTTQWTNGYPSKEIMTESIELNELFVCTVDGDVQGVFCWSLRPDPNYRFIENGRWLNSEEYGVIHRLAGSGVIKGLGEKVVEWCSRQRPNIRIDTHESNEPMLRLMKKLSFQYCGVIYVSDGTPRIAFQKVF